MILLSNKKVNILIKNILYPLIFLLIIFEIFFHVVFYFDIEKFKKTILFFNPYCDQKYWDYEKKSNFNKEIYELHPLLTFIKKENRNNYYSEKNTHDNKLKIFYGSSFIDHKYFNMNFQKNINYAVKSYGLDQIYNSYDLTKKNHPNKLIIVGFLLEDLDRTVFNIRNFPKLKYKIQNFDYEITNIPINLKKENPKSFTFYSYNFIKNIIFLINNNFDYKKSKCKITYKKKLFKFLIDNLINDTKKLNQNLVIITFNFSEDILSPNWRYNFIKSYLKDKNVKHIDTLKILNKDIALKQTLPSYYYSTEDSHLNKIGFDLVSTEIKKVIKQYK